MDFAKYRNRHKQVEMTWATSYSSGLAFAQKKFIVVELKISENVSLYLSVV